MREHASRQDEDIAAERSPQTDENRERGVDGGLSSAMIYRQFGVLLKAAPTSDRDKAAGLSRSMIDGDVQGAAEAGIGGPTVDYPHRGAIEASFGRPLDARAHVSQEACADLGAEAYATGSDVAFASSQPGLHTAAHEAAHVLQQSSGVQKKGAGDTEAQEREADAIADRVVRGESAAELLPAGGGGGASGGPVRFKKAAETEAGEAKAEGTADVTTAAPDAAKAAGDDSAVLTRWYVDYWGAGRTGREKAHGDRKSDDVLIVNGLSVGPRNARETFKGGNSLSYGSAHLGDYQHPRGGGEVAGQIQYAKDRDLSIQLRWGSTVDKEEEGAAAEAKRKVEAIVKSELDDPAASGTGDWAAVEEKAEAAAEGVLPDHDPDVTISHGKKSANFTLQTVDYDVGNPANCTAEIIVPTTTTEEPWSTRTETETSGSNASNASSRDKKKVGVDVEVEGGLETEDKSSRNKSHDQSSSTTSSSSSKKVTKQEIEAFYERIEEHADRTAESLTRSFSGAWEKLYSITREGGAVEIEEEGAEGDLGLGDRIKNWLKSKAKGLWEDIKEKFVSIVKSKLKKLLWDYVVKKGGRYVKWFKAIEWGVRIGGYLWDAYKVYVKLKKGKTEEAPEGKDDDEVTNAKEHGIFISQQWFRIESDIEKEVSNSLKTTIRAGFKRITEEELNESSSSTTTAKDHDDSSSSSSDKKKIGGKVGVDHDTESETSSDSSSGSATRTVVTRTYSGKRIKINAGHPAIRVKIEETS